MANENKVVNKLFNEKKMEEFINRYNDDLVIHSPENNSIDKWIDKLKAGELKDEKSNYFNFRDMILIDILGYDREDIPFENNIGKQGHPVEFTLLKGNDEYVIIELKGSTYKDLNKRKNKRPSPIEQATNYASVKSETKWAIVSNYDEIRLFEPNHVLDYISFKFEDLKDEKVLKQFLLVFSKFSLIEKDIPRTLLSESLLMEKEFEDEFYNLFSETRLMLINELEYSSDEIDRAEAIRLAQLILNRYIFLCFAEDLFLIKPETTTDVISTPLEKCNLADYTMWERLNELFKFANLGNKARRISPFNGGLFKEDLKDLLIRDFVDDLSIFDNCYKKWEFEENYQEISKFFKEYENNPDYKDMHINPIFKNLLVISSFDFGSELDVNILGHIFENSIGDIEKLQNNNKGKRKKDGVFYTPEYITDYICRTTIIPYLSISGKAKTVHELLTEYENSDSLDKLDNKLETLKIIDPACGSGSILNKSVDVLLEIHKAIYDSKWEGDSSLDRYYDTLENRKTIILNNIYGVDLNEESVEITKLSLFLKLATSKEVKEGFKLPNLNRNIKCGDSLINDKSIVDNKAFDWENEFEEIYGNGGFNIIVGNPPYVDIKEMDPTIAKYIFENYPTASNRINLYSTFVEKSYSLLKHDGMFSFIMPNSILFNSSYSKIRELLLNNTSILNIVRTSDDVFDDVSVEPIILTYRKNFNPDNETKIQIKTEDIDEIPLENYPTHYMEQKKWLKYNLMNIFYSNESLELLEKIETDKKVLINCCDFSLGLTPYDAAKGMSEDIIKNRLYHSPTKIDDTYKELLDGSDITRYNVHWGGKEYIKYGDWLGAPRDPKFFRNPRIIVRQILSGEKKRIYAGYSEDELYNAQIGFNLVLKDEFDDKNYLKYLLGIINSKLMTWYHEEKFIDKTKDSYPKILIENAKQLPIEFNNELFESLVNKVNKMISVHEKLVLTANSFRSYLNIGNITNRNKLYSFWELNSNEFIDRLNKKRKLNSDERKNLRINFEENVNIINECLEQIKSLEREIDQIVYEIYNLTPEEIEMIENSFRI